MDQKSYFQLEIGNVQTSIEDELTYALFEIGAEGVSESLLFEQKNQRYLPEVIEQEVKTLIAYFGAAPDPKRLQEMIESYPEQIFSLGQLPVQDWLAEWKKQWQPFAITSRLWIVPDWEVDNFDREQGEMIVLEPGMAFGTGTHETTQIAAHLIETMFQQQKVQSLLDVGTGSGLLAFMAERLGADNIYAYDNDPESKRVYAENLEKNARLCPNQVKVERHQWMVDWSTELSGKVDITVANIIDGVLMDLKPEFLKVKSPFFIFTGVLLERETDFLEAMLKETPWKIMQREARKEWAGYIFESR